MKEDLQYIKQRFHIVGNAPALNQSIAIAMQVAPTDLSVLITGESGTGKESFSKLIHALSVHRHGNFIAVNCGAIPEGTIDSELFGHEKGSFTGALESRKGYFETANKGTLFLDEIGEMPLGTQKRLLRVLEYGEYVKVGSSTIEKTNVRIVAATHVNLLQAAQEGKFREDLYYRMSTVPIVIPPLRERGMDSILLFHKFASDFATKYQIKPIELTPKAKERLVAYSFPGNIRQLKNVVEQISLLADATIITPEILGMYLPKEPNHMLPTLYKKGEDQGSLDKEFLYTLLLDMRRDVTELKKCIFDFMRAGAANHPVIQETHPLLAVHPPAKEPVHLLEGDQALSNPTSPHIEALANEPAENLSIEAKERELIQRSLQKSRGNRKQAADALGISERTLYRKIKQYGIIEEKPTEK
ncbi:MAG TPA: sigma-54 dependent transcriptional regulator [Amoebophilaceae bacterium]|nr:sigma-54 dependent transcriptional regulator [Amoebophilaceae bacterium]